MSQAAGRAHVFDRRTTRMAWDLDRSAAAVSMRSSARDIDGLMRALSLALPVSALLWLGCAILVFKAIR